MPTLAPMDMAKARRMRHDGATWDEIGEAFGISGETAHRRLDLVYAQRVREQIASIKHGNRVDKACEPVVAPVTGPDNRSWQQRMFGDPPHWRSALARRQQ
jgi:hypothetical protein